MRPYGVMADLHCHPWTAFATVSKDGVNSRLVEILHEVERCCQSVLELGGDTVVIAGDLFHVRGSVSPSVFNPLRDRLRHWVNEGIRFIGIPGNHDLEGKHTDRLSSAVAMLNGMQGVDFFHRREGNMVLGMDHTWALVPWIARHGDLLGAIEDLTDDFKRQSGVPGEVDLIIHAGIDGVLKGMPDHGLTAERLAEFGFRRVFAGHYHHHAAMAGGKVFSVGAPVHHTWGDIGTKAGWLIVDESNVRWMASHAPSFIEVTGDEDPDELPLIVDGHYVRARIGRATAAEVAHWRKSLTDMGARGVMIQSVPSTTTVVRTGAVTSLNSLDDAVAGYAKDKGYDAGVVQIAQNILAEVRA
jgi:DNA repair exonuclease SbcCD nuclease subunit